MPCGTCCLRQFFLKISQFYVRVNCFFIFLQNIRSCCNYSNFPVLPQSCSVLLSCQPETEITQTHAILQLFRFYTFILSAMSLLTANCLPCADTIIFPQKFWITLIVLPSSIWPSLKKFRISGAPNIHFMVQALPAVCADKFRISPSPLRNVSGFWPVGHWVLNNPPFS